MNRKLLLFLIMLCNAAAAQQPLSQSSRTSSYKYVYRISAREALALYTTNLYKVSETYLHTRVDSFPVKGAEPPLRNGNYLVVHAGGNRLQYELKSVGDLQLKVVNNGKDLAVVLHRRDGALVEGAKVSLGSRNLAYDSGTKSYRLNNRSRAGTLRVVLDGTAYYFPLDRPGRNTLNFNQWIKKVSYSFPFKYLTGTIHNWKGSRYRYPNYYNSQTANERKFRSFVTFSKPIYRPGDTVRLKAFVLQKNSKAVKEQLLLRLTGKYFDTDTVLAVVKPYQPGGYTYEFILNDSLDLDLDEGYLVTLEEERSRRFDVHTYEGEKDEDEYALQRKVVARGKFEYEEYELESITFSARADKKEHSRGETLALFLKATDENDLPVMDGRLEITVLARSNSSGQFHGPQVYLPDTLWRHAQPLEMVGETKVPVPDSIFPRASFDYETVCILLNSNNERQVQHLHGSFRDDAQKLSFTLQKDSLFIDLVEKGASTPAAASVWAFYTTRDSSALSNLQLPAAIKVNPYAHFYRVRTGAVRGDYHLSQGEDKVTVRASRTKDSLFIRLDNPERLPVWYTVFAGNRAIYRGYVDTLVLNTRTRTPKNYFLSLQYVYGNKVHDENYTIAYQDKLLNLAVNTPAVVYPGQRATIEIGVTDADGKPVADADLTAYSFTRKFAEARAPFIPYLGKSYRGRKSGTEFRAESEKEWKKTSKLNWERWSREIGLDSMEYFKFLHPDSLYRNTEVVHDSITQLAPFVVIKGELQPVHLLYIDEKPVFFSQSQHLQRYSFRVQPGKHTLRLRVPDRVITLKDIEVPKGIKTIISINGDTSNRRIVAQKAPDTLTRQERALLTRYSILVQSLYGENLAYVEQGYNRFLLSKPPYQNYGNQYLVGPLLPQAADLVVVDTFRQPFDVEAGYSYRIKKGLIKQKEVNTSLYIRRDLSRWAPDPNFSDLVLTGDEVDSLWADYLDSRSATEDLFVHPYTEQKGNGLLKVDVAKDTSAQEVFVKNIFLFRYEDTDFIRVYRGGARDLGYLSPGLYRLYFLLKDDRYLLKDSVRILKDGVNFYAIGAGVPRQRDSVSRKLAQIIQKREGGRRIDNENLDRIKESFNARFLQASDFHHTATGQVKDEKGQPLPGVTIAIKGTRFGTTTDANGFFSLDVPEKGTLVFSTVGFQSVEQAIEGTPMDVLLTASTHHLEEVVVVGYGTVRKRSLTASVSVVQGEGLSGRVAGVQLRGTGSATANSKPLIVVDGVLMERGLESMNPADIASTMVLKQAEAVALYGSRAANGVIMITTKKAVETAAAGGEGLPVPGNSIRRNFRDDAYWQPSLRTGMDGKARFTATFPDDITSWRTYAIAMASGKRTGFAEGTIRSFKPVSANLLVPQFAVEGDQVNIIGKTLNYGTDSLQLKRSIAVNNQVRKEGHIGVRNSYLDTISLTVAPGDSVHFRLQIQKQDGYFDGEERSIPVFRQGVVETRGIFAALEGDTAFTVQLDPALGPVSLNAEASLLPVLLDEAEKVYRYEYLCNEQLASKLKALITQKKVSQFLKKDFKEERAITEIINRLNNNKTGQLWGWWVNNEPSPWISLHVVEALLMAEGEGYKTALPKAGLVDYLVYRLEDYRSGDKIFMLNLLKQLDAKVDYKKYVDSLDKMVDRRPGRTSLYHQLRLIELQQKVGMSYSVDSILSKAKHTLFGNLYWGEEGHHFFDNSIQNTILVYRILKGMGGQEAALRRIRNYFLEKRKDGQWRNTYESSLILETIYPDLLVGGEAPRPAVLHLNGGEAISKFPYHCEISAGGKISLRKQGDLPLYFTAFQQLWNTQPQAVADAFTVRTRFDRNGDTLYRLKAGEPVTLEVEVVVKGDADYVMIEIPIPAGCSYKDKPQSYYNNEVHREYFKNKVSIFCSSLKGGKYTFRVPLLPRYTGYYHLNPAKAEMMYFPVFYGREGMKKVSVY